MFTNRIVAIVYNTYTYQISTLYTSNIHNVTCQLYLRKAGTKDHSIYFASARLSRR